MPFSTSAILLCKESVFMPAKGQIQTDVTRTGGRVAAAFAGRSTLQTDVSVDAYRYKNFEAKGKMCTCVEIRDAQGRVKWAEDECRDCNSVG